MADVNGETPSLAQHSQQRDMIILECEQMRFGFGVMALGASPPSPPPNSQVTQQGHNCITHNIVGQVDKSSIFNCVIVSDWTRSINSHASGCPVVNRNWRPMRNENSEARQKSLFCMACPGIFYLQPDEIMNDASPSPLTTRCSARPDNDH